MIGETKNTERGFAFVEFTDAYGFDCSLQESSAVGDEEGDLDNPGSSFIWLGIDEPKPQVLKSQAVALGLDVPPGEVSGWMPYQIPEEVQISTRMHLSREQVKDLIGHLQVWLDTGSI